MLRQSAMRNRAIFKYFEDFETGLTRSSDVGRGLNHLRPYYSGGLPSEDDKLTGKTDLVELLYFILTLRAERHTLLMLVPGNLFL